jgi:phosphohistidine swiveling domain-containing protein
LRRFSPKGFSFNKLACSHDEIRWLFDQENMVEAGILLVRELTPNPRHEELFFNLFDRIAETHRQACIAADHARPSTLSNEEIVSRIKGWLPQYLDLWDMGCCAELMDFALQGMLTKELGRAGIVPKDANELLTALTMPQTDSFSRAAEKSVLGIAADIRKRGLAPKKAFTDAAIGAQMGDHLDRFYWSSCNYFVFSGLGRNNLQALVEEALNQPVLAQQALSDRIAREKELVERTEKLEKRFALSEKTLALFGLARRVAVMFDDRKKSQMHAFYHIGRLLKELAKRQDVDFDLAKYLTPYELDAFVAGKISTETLAARRQHLLVDYNAHPARLLTGVAARSAEEGYWKDSAIVHGELSGVCASPGTVRGRARVIRVTRQLHELQKGEILVTSMTTPEFVPVLDKAIGIVTDDGGITCHAAIIARELDIPCIVGTKTATRSIKTGDLLELRAHHGLCRVVERRSVDSES